MLKGLYAGMLATLIVGGLLILPPFGPLSLAVVFVACDEWPSFCQAITWPEEIVLYIAAWSAFTMGVWLLIRFAPR